jgi:uncharacterized protein YprB with RNaseH-like and TPR domain
MWTNRGARRRLLRRTPSSRAKEGSEAFEYDDRIAWGFDGDTLRHPGTAKMIESSFCFLPGVGLKTEQRLWRDGVSTWMEFLSADSIPSMGAARKALYDQRVAEAQERRRINDARYFALQLNTRDHWRLYEWLRPRACYLDIETNSFGQVTVVGLYGNRRMTSLVRGESLSESRLQEELAQYDLLVTFCGTTFDLPVLTATFPGLVLEQPHVDLCFVGRRLGLRGGLKAVELQTGIEREAELLGMNGADAICLWNRWRHRRDEEARRLLLAYNEADCVNLEPLADQLYCRMVQQVTGAESVPDPGF